MRLYILDFIIMNGIAILATLPFYLIGKGFAETFLMTLFALSGLLLIAGGAMGFLSSSSLSYNIAKIFKGKRGWAEPSAKKETAEKPSKRGLRFIITGVLLFVESALLAIVYII